MRYPAPEKLEIIRLVEQSHRPVKRTLEKLGIPRATFYRWYNLFQAGGPEALEDRPPRPDRVWNRIPDEIRRQIIGLALDEPDLSPRELAVSFTDTKAYMPYFPQDLFERANAKGDLREEAYLKAKEECRRMSRTDGIDKVINAHMLDALIAPTDGTPPWAIDLLVGDHIVGGCSAPPAMAGYPHVTVPAGMYHGLPGALSFFGGAWQDGKLLGFAFAFEQATHARRVPVFKPTVA
jgi:Asp-tRNA(Asn)/Glu-tRNA(Gln) amidotransferase A subunit family amidase